ncbi:MAG: tRNA lysidine(34) synthetase TilS [Lachnospiraceae bacterium]|nr:tRNA lysidine(34) synthetase TilS [Lachnospiraceae bacterium]
MEKDIIYEKVVGYIKENHLINPGDTIVEGLSGGADSVCLFLMLEEYKKELGFNTVAVHVHHGIRKKTADKDQKFVEKLCASAGVELKTYRKDIPLICKITKETEEECGRRIRYEIFDEVCSQYENAKIAVAHHMNDQAETVIFRIIRGSGIKGLTGMEAKRDNIIRPLLCIKREEIEEYLKEADQDYRTDETNSTLEYSRNYIRKKIIPKFETVRKNAVEHINALSGEAADINRFMEKKAAELLDEASKEADRKYITKGLSRKFKADVLMDAEPILLKFAVRALISESGVSIKDVTRSHIDALCELIAKPKSGEISLPKGTTVVKESGIVYIKPKEGFNGEIHEIVNVKENRPDPIAPVSVQLSDRTAPEPSAGFAQNVSSDEFYYPVTGEGNYALPDGSIVTCRIINEFETDEIPDDTYTKWMDYAKMSDDLCLRTRKTGDYLVINKNGNEGNLKNYMINEKIPKSERDSVPLLASGSKIYWVIGHRISEDVKVTEGTNMVIEFSYKKAEPDSPENNESDSEGAENE